MEKLEKRIKDYTKEQGVRLVGIAGPERLNGPPSMDPSYTLRGARSVVALALPMDVEAIYDFLGKKSPVPHNVDQVRMNQEMHRICARLAGYIRSQGYRAAAVPPNNTYRRSLDVFATHPSFSHRFGAIAAGIAGQGWSGNVMTEPFGAAVYLGTVVTEAVLESDPALSPRHFIDHYCRRCRLCEKTCVAGMFEGPEEEYVLINGALHPRAKRRNIDFCNASCFGLHSLSRDRKWTTWGHHWIRDWVESEPDPTRKSEVRRTLLREGGRTGDSTARYDVIRRVASMIQPAEVISEYVDSHPERYRESERFEKCFLPFAGKLGVTGLLDDRILTCGQCAMVCGPTLEETARRYNTLVGAGLVVPGPGGEMVNVAHYEEAVEVRANHRRRVSRGTKIRDGLKSMALWYGLYFGIELRSILQGLVYRWKLRKALAAAPPVPSEQPESAPPPEIQTAAARVTVQR